MVDFVSFFYHFCCAKMYCSWCCHQKRYFIDLHYFDGNSDITMFI